MSYNFFRYTYTPFWLKVRVRRNTPILRPGLDFSRPSVYANGYRMRD